MVLDVIILFVCLYFSFSNLRELLRIPFSEWQLVQYLLLLITLAFVALAVHRVLRLWKYWKKRPQKAAFQHQGARQTTEQEINSSDTTKINHLPETDIPLKPGSPATSHEDMPQSSDALPFAIPSGSSQGKEPTMPSTNASAPQKTTKATLATKPHK